MIVEQMLKNAQIPLLHTADVSGSALFQGDCLDIMPLIPDKSIDMILCDLPYGTTACKWDVVIPFEPLWEQYERIIKDNGVIALFGSEPFSTKLRMSNFKLYRYDWYWEKTKAGLYQHAKNRPMKAIETISVFSKAKCGHKSQVKNRMPYNPQGITSAGKKIVTESYNAGGVVGKRPNQVGKEYEAFTGFPKDVLKYANICGKQVLHSTQKPVDLLEYLIKTYTNEGETVLDNCAGSGSTGVACLNTNRNFICIEKDENYFKIAEQRINARTLFSQTCH